MTHGGVLAEDQYDLSATDNKTSIRAYREPCEIKEAAKIIRNHRLYSRPEWLMFKESVRICEEKVNPEYYDISIMSVNGSPIGVCLLNTKIRHIQVFVKRSFRGHNYGLDLINHVVARQQRKDDIWGSTLSANNGVVFKKAGVRSVYWDYDLENGWYE